MAAVLNDDEDSIARAAFMSLLHNTPHNRRPLLEHRLVPAGTTQDQHLLIKNSDPLKVMDDSVWASEHLHHMMFSGFVLEKVTADGSRILNNDGHVHFHVIKIRACFGIFAHCHVCWKSRVRDFRTSPFPASVSPNASNLARLGSPPCRCTVCNDCVLETERKYPSLTSWIPCLHCGTREAFHKEWIVWAVPHDALADAFLQRDANSNWRTDHIHQELA